MNVPLFVLPVPGERGGEPLHEGEGLVDFTPDVEQRPLVVEFAPKLVAHRRPVERPGVDRLVGPGNAVLSDVLEPER